MQVGDIVDWLGQDSLVLGINRGGEKPVRIKNLVAGDFWSVSFEEINDILRKNTFEEGDPIVRSLEVFRAILSDKVKNVSNLF